MEPGLHHLEPVDRRATSHTATQDSVRVGPLQQEQAQGGWVRSARGGVQGRRWLGGRLGSLLVVVVVVVLIDHEGTLVLRVFALGNRRVTERGALGLDAEHLSQGLDPLLLEGGLSIEDVPQVLRVGPAEAIAGEGGRVAGARPA